MGSERMVTYATIIGRNLRNIRLLSGYSQKQIAGFLGVTFQQVQKYETGKNRIPIEKVVELKRLLGVSYDELLEPEGTQTSQKKKCSELLYLFQTLQKAENQELRRKVIRIIKILLED